MKPSNTGRDWWEKINMSGHGEPESSAFYACFGKELEQSDFEVICEWAAQIAIAEYRKELAAKMGRVARFDPCISNDDDPDFGVYAHMVEWEDGLFVRLSAYPFPPKRERRMKTTLNKIKAHRPCADGWAKLLAHLGKTQADDEPLSLLTILESNGLDDALWALRAVDGYDREKRLLACDYADRVLHLWGKKYPDDSRVADYIATARRFANGEATDDELDAAWDAARAAARAAARDAVGAAARDAWDGPLAAERKEQERLFIKMVNENDDAE